MIILLFWIERQVSYIHGCRHCFSETDYRVVTIDLNDIVNGVVDETRKTATCVGFSAALYLHLAAYSDWAY